MKRITSIFGAGAVLNFDFGDLLSPSTQNITAQRIFLVGETRKGWGEWVQHPARDVIW